MEVAGGVTTIIALLETTGKLYKFSKKLIDRWNHAPEEIKVLAKTLRNLDLKLSYLQSTASASHGAVIDATVRGHLFSLLEETEAPLQELDALQCSLDQSSLVRKRARWMLKDEPKVASALADVKRIQEELSEWITLIQFRGQGMTLEGIQTSTVMMLEGFDRMEQLILTTQTSAAHPGPSSSTAQAMSRASSTQLPPNTFSGRTITGIWRLADSWNDWGISAVLITSSKDRCTDRDASFRITLPLNWLFGHYALTGSLSWRTFPLCRNQFSFRHPSYFALARVVSGDHPFIVACCHGDLDTVQFMLRSGGGRPTDVTAEGKTPMWYAVRYGHVGIAAELLDSGLDVESQTDSDSATGLLIACGFGQINVVRLLLDRGASQDRLDPFGASAGILCWVTSLAEKWPRLSKDIFNLLRENDHQDINAGDGMGKTALHYAALAGGRSQIDDLRRLGGDIHKLDTYGNAPIARAISYGNFSTYSALISHYGQDTVKHRDEIEIGESLLDSAYDAATYRMSSEYTNKEGIVAIAKDLLRRGADPQRHAQLQHWRWDGLRGGEGGAFRLAAALGPDIEAWYLDILRSNGFLHADEYKGMRERLERHDTTGFVYEPDDADDSAEEESDDEESDQSWDADDGAEDENDDEESDQFWDAEEVVS